MEAFKPIDSHYLPLPDVNIDTDQLTPARFLKTSRAAGGYGEILLYDWRFDGNDRPRPESVLNAPARAGAEVVVAGDNFGCGSSRETAVWALVEYGVKAVISTSFGDIFHNNSLKNGLLPIRVEEAVLQSLLEAGKDPAARVRITLDPPSLTLPDGRELAYEIDGFYQECLLKGLDPMGYLLEKLPRIEAWEKEHPDKVRTVAG